MSDAYSVGEFLGEFVTKAAALRALEESVVHLNQVAKNSAYYQEQIIALRKDNDALSNNNRKYNKSDVRGLATLYRRLPEGVIQAAYDISSCRDSFSGHSGKIAAIRYMRSMMNDDNAFGLKASKDMFELFIE